MQLIAAPVCPYCGDHAKLVTGEDLYPHREDLFHLKFWRCAPCDAYVGCHRAGAWAIHEGQQVESDGTLPLGRLANRELRIAKSQVHQVFDPIWKLFHEWRAHPAFDRHAKYDKQRRTLLYKWLAREMGIPLDACHIGMFDLEQCRKATQIIAWSRRK